MAITRGFYMNAKELSEITKAAQLSILNSIEPEIQSIFENEIVSEMKSEALKGKVSCNIFYKEGYQESGKPNTVDHLTPYGLVALKKLLTLKGFTVNELTGHRNTKCLMIIW
jgi:hypothetical protein